MMEKIALLASLASAIPCTIHAMDVNAKIGNIIKLAQHESHFSSRTVGDVTYNPEVLVMHYTAETLDRTVELFTGPEKSVSAHYIISQEGSILQNIEEMHAAHHAGLSSWRGITGAPAGSRTGALNLRSLGIEHVNMGYKEKDSQPEGIFRGDRQWYQFDERQIAASIKLAQALVEKHKIKPEDVVGHSDIAPKRKVDPGPLFPWDKFAENCVGAWPDPEATYELACFAQAEEAQDDDEHAMLNWTIEHLNHWGYKLPDDKDESKKPEERASAQDIVKTFQMHFRPWQIDGTVDVETATLLKSLLCQYKGALTQCPCEKHE
jgi:N-acetylmuramoyl-L-alanine amidase